MVIADLTRTGFCAYAGTETLVRVHALAAAAGVQLRVAAAASHARLGAAVGIALIGTVLFGTGQGGSSAKTDSRLLHAAQWAILAELGLIAGALACSLALPRSLGTEHASGNNEE